MTIDSVAITKAAVLNTGTNEIRIPSAVSSGSVALTVHPNPITTRTIQCGVPLPKGGTSSPNELMLKDELGQELDAQFDVLGEYPDGSIRSVLITTDVTADPVLEKIYSLDYGAGVTRSSYSSNLGYTEDANEIVVSTGKIRVKLDKASGQLFKQILADTAQDLTYATEIASSSEIKAKDALDSDTEYSSTNYSTPTFTILRNGPLNLHIKQVLWLRDAGDTANYVEVYVYYDFFRDSDEIKITQVLIDRTPQPGRTSYVREVDEVEFACSEYSNIINHSIASNQQYIHGGENNASEGPLSTPTWIFQNNRQDFTINGHFNSTQPSTADDPNGAQYQTYTGVQAGTRAKGYCSVHDGTIGLSTMFKNFWQQSPKELNTQTDKTILYLHPPQANTDSGPDKFRQYRDSSFVYKPKYLYDPKPGLAKHYEFIYKVHMAQPVASDLENITANLNDLKFQLQCTSDYYCSSGWLFNLKTTDANQAFHHNFVRNSILAPSLERIPDRMEPIGWRDFGDTTRHGYDDATLRDLPFYNGNHIGGIRFFIWWMKTFDEAWLKKAVNETDHFIDIDVMHSEFQNWSKKPAWEPWPAGQQKVSDHKHEDHHVEIYGGSHVHASAIVPMYLLTGKRWYFDAFKEMADFFIYLKEYDFPRPRPAVYSNHNRAYVEAERDCGWIWHFVMEYTKLTNDRDLFISYCQHFMDYCVDWWKTKQDHWLGGEVVGTYDWEAGTATLPMDETDNGHGGHSTGGHPWLMASILWPMCDFIIQDADFASGADVVTYKQMMFQIVEHIFTWQYSSNGYDFYDSEPRGLIGVTNYIGAVQLISPVLYIFKWFKEELDAGRIANPEWFRPWLWLEVFKNNGARYISEGMNNWNPWGFYGYEASFPDTWWTMWDDFNGEADSKYLSQAGWDSYVAGL